MTAEAVRQALDTMRQRDLPLQGGRSWAHVHGSGLAEAEALGREALATFGSTDAGRPSAFPSLARMEQELIARTADLLDGPAGVVGTVTASGADSALLAVQAARDAQPGRRQPRMVLPASAHPAFARAGRLLGVEAVPVAVDRRTGRADPAATAAALTDDTVLVVVSAPSYPYGVVDPVTEIATAAQARGIRCHVDAATGGWLLPYLRPDEPEQAAFSFLVPGVTSVSVDLDTYAYAPTGVSVLLHRDAALRRPQLITGARWPGHPVVGAAGGSSRSGGGVAAAWAVTRFIGDQGYARLAAVVREGVWALVDGLADVAHVRVLVPPDAGLVAVATDGSCDPFTVCDELSSRGWHVEPQLGAGPFPPTVHLCVSAAGVPRLPELLDAIKASVKAAVSAGPVRLPDRLVAAVRTVDLRTLDDEGVDALLAPVGLAAATGVRPERMAPLHALLDAATPPVREALLLSVLDRSSRPRR